MKSIKEIKKSDKHLDEMENLYKLKEININEIFFMGMG